MEIEDYLAVNQYVARTSLNIDTGSFYDKWSFLWENTMVLATVSRYNNHVHIVSSMDEEVIPSVLEFIEMEKESGITDEDQESWN